MLHYSHCNLLLVEMDERYCNLGTPGGTEGAQDWCCPGLQEDAAPQCPASQAALAPSLNLQALPTPNGKDLPSWSGCPGAWQWFSPRNCQL